jgi:hypothetical protein
MGTSYNLSVVRGIDAVRFFDPIMFMDCFPKKEDWPEQGIECLSKKGFSKANGPILPAEDY